MESEEIGVVLVSEEMKSKKIGYVLVSYPVVGESRLDPTNPRLPLPPSLPWAKAWVFSDVVSKHVCNSRAKFNDDYRPVSREQHVSLKNGDKVDVAGIGSVTMSFTGGRKVTIPDVLHIPTFVYNFLNVDEFAGQWDFEVAFDPEDAKNKAMIYKGWMLVARGFFRGRKFFLNVD